MGWIYDLESWGPFGKERVEGNFRPILSFGRKGKETTIIPFVLSKSTSWPTNTVGIRKADSGRDYGYDRFEYVRFTKFEIHYESGYVQKLLKDDLSFREKKFNVFSPKIGMDLTSLFRFHLDRVEKCRIVVEGYSKLIKGNKEEVFRLTKGYHIRKRKSVRTGRDRLGSV